MGISVDIALHDDYLIELSLLIVPAEMRRHGLASAFVQKMCRRASEDGVTIELYSEPIDGALSWGDLNAFYERFGFVPTDDGMGYYIREP